MSLARVQIHWNILISPVSSNDGMDMLPPDYKRLLGLFFYAKFFLRLPWEKTISFET